MADADAALRVAVDRDGVSRVEVVDLRPHLDADAGVVGAKVASGMHQGARIGGAEHEGEDGVEGHHAVIEGEGGGLGGGGRGGGGGGGVA